MTVVLRLRVCTHGHLLTPAQMEGPHERIQLSLAPTQPRRRTCPPAHATDTVPHFAVSQLALVCRLGPSVPHFSHAARRSVLQPLIGIEACSSRSARVELRGNGSGDPPVVCSTKRGEIGNYRDRRGRLTPATRVKRKLVDGTLALSRSPSVFGPTGPERNKLALLSSGSTLRGCS